MNPMHQCYIKLKQECAKIHIVDKCLIVIMFVLLMQSAYTLFSHSGESAEMNNIDIIIRTSAAAVFGYFLSANFMKHAAEKNAAKGDTAITAAEINVISNRNEAAISHLQILFASFICLFCLIVLIVMRNMGNWNYAVDTMPSYSATVTQFRDFISGCVGFLIGCPTSKTGKNNSV